MYVFMCVCMYEMSLLCGEWSNNRWSNRDEGASGSPLLCGGGDVSALEGGARSVKDSSGMYVFMCVCMYEMSCERFFGYVCVYVCMYVCMYVCCVVVVM